MYLKCVILVTNLQKSPSVGGALRFNQAPFKLRFWWPKVVWFAQIVVFQSDYDEIDLKNS